MKTKLADTRRQEKQNSRRDDVHCHPAVGHPSPRNSLPEARKGDVAVSMGAGKLELLSCYLMFIGRGALLTRREEVILGTKARSGKRRARRELIERNLRFVVSVATG